MKIRLIILAFLFTQIFYCQIKIQEDNLTIEYAKTKKASQMIGAVTNVRTESNKIVQYNIKVRIEMIDNKKRPFDPNKFSLIDYQNRIRLRPIDVAYTNFTDKAFYQINKA
jgi:ribosome biogenesis SPOUT family RNA methylase Rps3